MILEIIPISTALKSIKYVELILLLYINYSIDNLYGLDNIMLASHLNILGN